MRISTIHIQFVPKLNQRAINLPHPQHWNPSERKPSEQTAQLAKTTLSLSRSTLSLRNNRRIIHNAGRIYGRPIVSQLIQALCHLTPPLPQIYNGPLPLGVIRHKRQRACAPRQQAVTSGRKGRRSRGARIERSIARIINYYGDWALSPSSYNRCNINKPRLACAKNGSWADHSCD